MNTSSVFRYVVQFLVLVGLQILLFKDFVIFNYSFCFVYIGAFLLVPFEMVTMACMVLAMTTGLLVDTFYDTLGIHAAACLLVAFLRGPYLKLLTPAGGYEGYMEPTMQGMGLNWYLLYYMPLAFLHHVVILLIEYSDPSMVGLALLKAALSAPLTWLVTLLLQTVLVPRS